MALLEIVGNLLNLGSRLGGDRGKEEEELRTLLVSVIFQSLPVHDKMCARCMHHPEDKVLTSEFPFESEYDPINSLSITRDQTKL